MSKQKHVVIYVPGIGDTNTRLQEAAVATWRLYGIVPVTFPMRWADDAPFQPKFDRLLEYIDTQKAAGHNVSLVGASAGATVVINAFAARPHDITGIVCIAGKINHPETIGPRYRRHSPSFVESANMCPASLSSLGPDERKRILSVYGRMDHVVPRRDSIVDGASHRRALAGGHAVTIGEQLLLGAGLNMQFLRSLVRS